MQSPYVKIDFAKLRIVCCFHGVSDDTKCKHSKNEHGCYLDKPEYCPLIEDNPPPDEKEIK
jgi:hypothetical protein